MKNIVLNLTLIIGFLITGFHAFSQGIEDVSPQEKLDLETVDLGFGIVQDKSKSTASTATIGSDKLERRNAISLRDALYGNILGLTSLKSSGNQGGWVGDETFGANFNIRGIQSITGSGVLVLVDGIPRSLDHLSVDEIESVSVMKDAAAVALYGYTGINGAISVKTKRGQQSGTKITARYNHKFTFGAEMEEYVDSYTYALAMNEARSNNSLSPAYNQFELDAYKNGDHPYLYPNINWKEEALRDMGSENVVGLTYSTGSDKVRFISVLNYTNSQGLLTNTETNKEDRGYSTQLKYSKLNGRMNLDVDLTSTTKFEVNVMAVVSENNRPNGLTPNGLFGNLNILPSGVYPVKTSDGKWGGSNVFATNNPVANIQETGYYREIGIVMNTDFKLTQSLEQWVEGLSITGRVAYDSFEKAYESRSRGYAWASDRYRFNADGSLVAGDNNTTRQSGGASTNQLTFGRGTSWQTQGLSFIFSGDYKKQIDDKHNLAGSLIFFRNKSVTTERYSTFYRSNVMGYIHYDLFEKYLADVVLTYTGSNRSYPQSWVFSPTVSLGWIISEEDFLAENETINFLKLRGSFGRLHTDYVPRNGSIWMDLYDGGNGSFAFTLNEGFNSVGGLARTYFPTTDFKLETANKFNIGVDALVFNSLNLNFEAFYQRRNNILMLENGIYSSMTGVTAGYANVGVVDSKGIELGLDFNHKFGDLAVNVGGMFTFGNNKVVDCVEEPKAFPWLEMKGQPVNQMRGLVAIGFFNNEADIANSPTQEFSAVRPGDIKYQGQRSERNVNSNDYIPIGYSNEVPEINYAFSAGLEYMGLGVNIVFQGASRYSQWYDPFPLISNRNITVDYYENRWTPSNPNAMYPALTSESIPNNEQNSTLWYKDASFLKLRNCEVYYKMPKSLLSRMYVSDIKLSVRGENLATWSQYPGLDPEMRTTNYRYPMLKGISAGLSITF